MFRVWLLCLFLLKQSFSLFTEKNACNSFGSYWIIDLSSNCFYNPDVGLNTPEILERHTNNYENHTVTTEDGYILQLFRIPLANPKGIMVLFHPATVDSFIFVGQGNASFAFYLWNKGYEVWLLNQRGTFLSEKHTNLTVDDYEYWNFSFHEIGIYDYSSTIKYISNITNNTELIVVGHSEGSTALIIYAALKPEEAKTHLKIIIPMALVTSVNHGPWYLRFFPIFFKPLFALCRILRIGAIERNNSLFVRLIRFLVTRIPFEYVYFIYVRFFTGGAPGEFDAKWYTELASQYPRATSVKIWSHYSQFINSNFTWYDYGKSGNLLRYQSETPPQYPVEKINVPLYIIVSDKDNKATEEDNKEFFGKLSEPAKIYGMYVTTKVSHPQYYYGKDSKEYVFEPFMSLVEKVE